MSAKSTYSLQSNDVVMDHGTLPPQMFLDISKKPTSLEVDAWVASEDLFAMLATALDAVSGMLTTDAKAVRPQLEHQINILLDLQRRYHVVRKQSDYRQ